jgi:hypothetical protein
MMVLAWADLEGHAAQEDTGVVVVEEGDTEEDGSLRLIFVYWVVSRRWGAVQNRRKLRKRELTWGAWMAIPFLDRAAQR